MLLLRRAEKGGRPVNATTTEIIATTSEAIDERRWEPMPQVGSGVSQKVLWQVDRSQAGLMRIEPHGEVAWHAHRSAHHHIWVLTAPSTWGEGSSDLVPTPTCRPVLITGWRPWG